MRLVTPIAVQCPWPKAPARALFSREQRAVRPDDGVVTAFRDGQVTLRSNRRQEGFTNAVEEIGYQGVRTGDLVIHSMDGFAGAIGVSESDGKASPVVHCYRPSSCVDVRYYAYLLRDLAIHGYVTSLAKGIRERSTAFDVETFRSLVLPVPPLALQRAIADYLDTETARIDALIAKKQRMIELLDERLQVERRRSFADERGWKLKHLLRAPMAYGILVPQFVDPESGVRMLRITNLDSSGGVVLSEVVWVPRVLSDEYRRTLVTSGDVVVSVVGSMGRSSVISSDVEGSNLNRALARLQLRADLDPWIMWHWTQTTDFLDQARLATGGGTAQPTLNLGDLAEFTVGLPTDPVEWPKIAVNLSKAYEVHRSVTSRLRRQIDLLREHRQALITAAVTGELEIPGVAA